METFFLVLFTVLVLLLVVNMQVQKNKMNTARDWYNRTLKGNDLDAAITAGQHYYSTLRRGPLTLEDLDALEHDLARMMPEHCCERLQELREKVLEADEAAA